MNLSQRILGEEITDDLTLATPEVVENLKEIALINRWLGGHKASVDAVRQLLPPNLNEPLTIADLGCGGGDTLKALAQSLKLPNLSFIGIDGNACALAYAKAQNVNNATINFTHADLFSKEFKEQKFDIAHLSLVCHHFTNEQLISLFKQLKKQCRYGFVINDLHRHKLALWGIKSLNGLVVKTRLGQHDGVQSVKRGFTYSELEALLQAAQIENFRIKWKWAFRWLVVVYLQ